MKNSIQKIKTTSQVVQDLHDKLIVWDMKSQKYSYAKVDVFSRMEKDTYVEYSLNSLHPKVSVETFVTEVMDFFENKKKPVRINLDKKTMPQVMKWLIKNKNTQDKIENFMDLILHNNSIPDFMWKLGDTEQDKIVLLKLLKTMNLKKPYISTRHFESLIKKLKDFDYDVAEYPYVKHFFDVFLKETQKNPHETHYYTMQFLKEKIKPEYWSEFAIYCPEEKGLLITSTETPLFEEEKIQVYNLKINCNPLRKKYIHLATNTDMHTMIGKVCGCLDKYSQSLNLKHAFVSSKDTQHVQVHFFYTKENEPDFENIKKIYLEMMDEYAKIFDPKESYIAQDKINELFPKIMMDVVLNDKSNKNKINKI